MTTNILQQVLPAIANGYRIVGDLLGETCDRYRGNINNNPISDLNHQDVIDCMFAFDAQFTLKKPRDYKSAQMFGSFDRTNCQVGDYLVSQMTNQTYFINSLENLTPNGVVICNAMLTFYRPTAQIAGGYKGNGYVNKNLNIYGGNSDNFGQPLAANWPVSMLLGTKGERAQVNIPDQSRIPWYSVKMPVIPGIELRTNDLVIFNSRRFLLSGCELTELGLNITLDEVTL